jgi:hypothetical protein
MKKFVWFILLISTTSSITLADSWDNLIKDAKKRLIFVENTGDCSGSGCDEPIVAKCPDGAKLVPQLSKCSGSIKSGNSDYVSFSKNSNEAEQKCDIGYSDGEDGVIYRIKVVAACTKLSKVTETAFKEITKH